jgi:VCBS repeat-containing protein
MTPNEGDTLTASNTLADTDGIGAVSYQWQRDGVDIAGGTGSTYTTVQADVGSVITVIATYTDGHGTLESVTSAGTAAVGNVNNAPTGSVTISGTPTEDQTLTAANTLADADGMGAVSYQWQRDGVDIAGATNTTYTLGDTDVSATITVVASYTDGGGTNESVASAGVGPIANVNDNPVGLPVITGTVTEDQTLTADASGITDDDGLGAFSYQWLRDGAVIAGATNSTYTLGDADVGTQISVQVTYTDAHSTAESVTSAQTAAVTNVNDAPTGSVAISGTPTEDQTLSASNTLADADGMGAVSYQWQRDGVDIAGATASTYTLGDADVGATITFVASYTDGHSTTESVTSAGVGPIANINDAPTGSVAIDNMTPNEGDTLTASNTLADTDGMGIVTYQWQRDGVDIAGGTGSTYTMVQADVGTVITVIATYTDGHGTLESVTSAGTAAVGNVNNAPTGSVTISGTPTEDQTLTASNTLADADGMGVVSYQWQRDGVDIASATGNTYMLGDADVGTTITVVASYMDGHGTGESVTSADVGPVANVNDSPAGLPVITGSVTEDQTLTADTSGISDADGLGAFSYQWLRDGVAIAGATSSTYTLGDTDVGAQVSVQVTYTDAQGTAESVTSAQTTAVTNVNDAPVGLPVITGTVTEDQTMSVDTSAITDADGLGAFSYQWLRDGVVIAGATGTTYTLGDADVGAQISVQVSYTDGQGTAESVTSAQTAPVVNVNDPAVIAGVDTGTVTEDVDPDVDGLLEVSGSLTIIDPDAGESIFNAGVFGGTYGVITLNAAGDWDYAANTSQPAIQALTIGDTLTDTITVSSADGTTHDIVITIMGTNDAPVAGNDIATVNEGGSVTIDLAASDNDIDNAIDLNSIVITGLPANGNVVVNGDGTVTYTHDGSETLNDSFTYTISDISGAVSNSATVTLTVTPVNDAPVAGDDVATVGEGGSVLIDVAANDSDAENALDLNSIVITAAPANGSLVVNGDGKVNYTHDGSNTLSDSFTYTISDITGAISNIATVNITVTAVNDVPTTSGIADVTVDEDAATTSIDLNAAFDDADNLDSELSYSIVGNTNIGLFSVAGVDSTTGRLSLDYAADMNGSAQITMRATDPSGASVDTLFTVTVNPVNDAPVLISNTGIQAVGDSPATISSSELNVADIDNTSSELVYTITALPANGNLMLNGKAMAVNDTFIQADLDNNLMAYRSNGTAAADQFGFTVSDPAGGAVSNQTFDIVVQLSQSRDEGNTDYGAATLDESVEEEAVTQEVSETGSGGAAGGQGGYGGDYVPIGSNSVPPKPAPVLTIERPASHDAEVPEPPASLEKIETAAVEEEYEVATFAAVQVESMDALWKAVDKMKDKIASSTVQESSSVELKVAAIESSGVVLSAGVVAWLLRSGALLSSLLSNIPVWKGYDPLPVLMYKDDEEEREVEIDEDKIPTSLEELKKLKELKAQRAKGIDVDSMFGSSTL